MSPKNCVNLIKDFVIHEKLLICGMTTLNSTELKVTPHPNIIGQAYMVNKIATCIQEFARMDWSFLRVGWKQGDLQMDFEVELCRYILDSLSLVNDISVQLYLDVLCKLPSASDTETAIFRRRYDVGLILDQTPFLEKWRLCSTPLANCLGKKATCDIILGWTEPLERLRMNTTSFMNNLFEKEATKDLVLCAANGAEIKCHRIILEAHSDILGALVSPNNGMQESLSGRIEMTENSEEGLSHLVRYLYGMELLTKDLTSDVAVELFKTCEKYKLTELQECLGELFIEMGRAWFSPDDLLELYFHVKNLDHFEELHDHLLRCMMSMPQEIRSCDGFLDLEQIDGKAAVALVWKLFDLATAWPVA